MTRKGARISCSRPLPNLAAFQHRVVCHARKVAGAIVVSLDEASQTRLVERMRRPRDLARILNHESDRLGPSSTRPASLANVFERVGRFPGSYIVEWPLSRLSYRMTYRMT